MTEFEYGHAARLRAARDYLGLGQAEMAERLGVALRSYERWEGGQSGIPTTLWIELRTLRSRQAEDIVAFVSRWKAARIDGCTHLVVPDFLTKWDRIVMARAMGAEPAIVVKFQDDLDAMKEESA